MKYFANRLAKQPMVLFHRNLEQAELRFLSGLVDLLGGTVISLQTSLSPGNITSGQILFTDSFHTLQEWRDWGLNVTCIGRFTKTQVEKLYRESLTSFWNLEEDSLVELAPVLLRQFLLPHSPRIFVWTKEESFVRQMRGLLEAFSLSCSNTSNPDYALAFLEDESPELLVLDWDKSGIEIKQCIEKMESIREKTATFPKILGIKDFSKENLFKDLASGVKDFCSYLFSYSEALQVFMESLPFYVLKEDEFYPLEEIPYIVSQYSVQKKYNRFSYEKENPHRTQKKEYTKYESDLNLFKQQFRWLQNFK
ncbi:MAG: hypothetical protein AAF518_05335 [Spirochaetota bacterium]